MGAVSHPQSQGQAFWHCSNRSESSEMISQPLQGLKCELGTCTSQSDIQRETPFKFPPHAPPTGKTSNLRCAHPETNQHPTSRASLDLRIFIQPIHRFACPALVLEKALQIPISRRTMVGGVSDASTPPVTYRQQSIPLRRAP